MKAPAKILAALALAAGLTMAAPSAAQAATTEPKPICTTWQARLVTVVEGKVHTEPGGASNISEDGVTLTRPNETTGVEYLARVDIDGPAVVTVDADYEEGADAAGALRIFGYDSDTVDPAAADAGAPDHGPATAPAELTFSVGAGEHLGTLGLTWDSSNPNFADPVIFSDLKINDRPVPFKACPEPEGTPSATPPATKTPTARPSASVEPTDVPVLPKTPGASSTKLAVLSGIGAVVVLAGLGLYFAARGRRTRYTAE